MTPLSLLTLATSAFASEQESFDLQGLAGLADSSNPLVNWMAELGDDVGINPLDGIDFSQLGSEFLGSDSNQLGGLTNGIDLSLGGLDMNQLLGGIDMNSLGQSDDFDFSAITQLMAGLNLLSGLNPSDGPIDINGLLSGLPSGMVDSLMNGMPSDMPFDPNALMSLMNGGNPSGAPFDFSGLMSLMNGGLPPGMVPPAGGNQDFDMDAYLDGLKDGLAGLVDGTPGMPDAGQSTPPPPADTASHANLRAEAGGPSSMH